MKDAKDLQVVSRLLGDCAPDADARYVVNILDIETMECFLIVEAYDFVKLCGFKIVQARKLAARISKFLSKRSLKASYEPSATTQLATGLISTEISSYTAVVHWNSAPVFEKPDEVNCITLVNDKTDDCPDHKGVDDSDEEFNITATIFEEEALSDGVGDLLPSREIRWRRDGRHGKKRSAQALLSSSHRSNRMCLVDPVARGVLSSGNGRAVQVPRGVAGKSCRCAVDLEAVIPQLVIAVRTDAERRARAKYSEISTYKVARYNLSRFAPLATSLFFDPLGNFVFHGLCICKKFGLGKDWLSSTHRRAVSLSKVPVVKVKKENLLKVDDALVERVVVPEGVCLSQKEHLISRAPQDLISLSPDRSNFHGLSGAVSNRTMKLAREFVVAFTRNNSSSNGRTRDAHGSFYGAPNCLDAKFLLYSKDRPGELRLGFTNECVRSMSKVEPFLSNPSLLIKPRTVRTI